MFDETRNALNEGGLFEDRGELDLYAENSSTVGFMGLTAGQRFILAILFFATVVVVGLTFLVVTQKVVF